MNEGIKLVLSLSLSGTILAVLIFTAKPFIKHKLSKSLLYYVWIVVLLRLVLPLSFEGSIMNKVFYGNQAPAPIAFQEEVKLTGSTGENVSNPLIITNYDETAANSVYNSDTDYSRYFKDLFNEYALYIWFLGAMIAFAVYLTGYARFIKYLKPVNKPATTEENRMLKDILNRRYRVRLVRNRFVTTPMLIGILRPLIIIPDIGFSEIQLKNILHHEITHLKRFDIGVKWITIITTSIHWFNPLMYFIKREINHACELSCDEVVIKNLSSTEKQAYGHTLISVVSENKYPMGALQATMSEEKQTLKERLVSIMEYSKKSKVVMIISGLLLLSVIICALYLGAGVGIGKDTPPNIYISTEYTKTKSAIIGTYSWLYRNTHTEADSDHPTNFNYTPDNIVSIAPKEQLILGTQNIKLDKKYDFTIDQISVYKGGQLAEVESPDPSFMNGSLYLQAPPDPGEYIYSLVLNFKGRGTVTYGFVVRVGMLSYDLDDISKYKTPYIGNHTKVSAIVGRLPAPDKYFKQQYISMVTSSRPYKLNVFYEAKFNTPYSGEWPIVNPDNTIYSNLQKNALVLFCMIDNLDEVTFLLRNSQSGNELDTSKYDTTFTFPRASIGEKYSDLTALSGNLNLLQDALAGKVSAFNE